MLERGNGEPIKVNGREARTHLHDRVMNWESATRLGGLLFRENLPVDDQTRLVEVRVVVDEAPEFAGT